MAVFLLKKIGGLLITVFSVSVLVFLLSKAVPGDEVEAILNSRGLPPDSDSPSYFEDYEKVYRESGLNHPVFYFSILPSFYPTKMPDDWTSRERKLAIKLLRKRIGWNRVNQTIHVIKSDIKKCEEIETANQCETAYARFYQSGDFTELKRRIEEINGNQGSNYHISPEVFTLAHNEKIGFYFPRIQFNGLNNQYHYWCSSILRGDFGTSILDGRPVGIKIWSALKWTLALTFISLFFALLIGTFFGVFSALNSTSLWARLITIVTYGLYAMPVFWLATLFIVFFTTPEFGKWTDIFPSPLFRVNPDHSIWTQMMSQGKLLILPVICLTLGSLAIVNRLVKQSVIIESVKPYVTALRAKGLNQKRIYTHHVIPNSLIPLITLITNNLPVAFAGSLVIEYIFNIPGMGRVLYDSIFSADWQVCYMILLFISIITSIILSIADLVYSWLDPQVKMK